MAALTNLLSALFVISQSAAPSLHVGDRVVVGSVGETGTVIEVKAQSGASVKVHLDRFGTANSSVGVWYDPVVSKVAPVGAPASSVRAAPVSAAQATSATPAATSAKAAAPNGSNATNAAVHAPAVAATCKVGDRVAMPAGFQDKWFDAVVVAVDASKPYPCRVHPLGYADTMNESFSASMLKAPGAVKTEPLGNLQNDPQLLVVQGKQAFRPTAVLPGSYECYALSGGQLSPRMALNFSIAGGNQYRDVSGAAGTYTFDAASLGMIFHGAALDGQHASYAQPSNPPNKNTPPAVTFATSGDSCDLVVK